MNEKKVRELVEDLKNEIISAKELGNDTVNLKKVSVENLEVVAEALEKQLPKEIMVIDEERSEEFGEVEFYCPNCNSHYLCDIADMLNYCTECGVRFNT